MSSEKNDEGREVEEAKYGCALVLSDASVWPSGLRTLCPMKMGQSFFKKVAIIVLHQTKQKLLV